MAHLLCFILFATMVVTSHGETLNDAEVYWKSVLPRTPIPRALAEILTANSIGVFHVRKDELLYPNMVAFYTSPWDLNASTASNPTLTLYVNEHELRVGQKLHLSFRGTSGGAFIPRASASTNPFSAAKLPEIQKLFRIKPDTLESQAMGMTASDCEFPMVGKDEKMLCATSLESMVDFATSTFQTRLLNAASTTILGKDEDPTPRSQQYVVSSVALLDAGAGIIMGCHKLVYPYAVFYCHHTTSDTRFYQVALAGSDGTPVKALVVCHIDTSTWDAKHVAFLVLHQKRGSTVCHILETDTIVWSRSA